MTEFENVASRNGTTYFDWPEGALGLVQARILRRSVAPNIAGMDIFVERVIKKKVKRSKFITSTVESFWRVAEKKQWQEGRLGGARSERRDWILASV
ncbi:uncharacterized protein SPSK_02860 [Sporothrix schenckii 1099-18]|uniref:Uncharacterized protein n=1 Tax=Sporothrix schenckii 1099-18 TaxID=1397361 RepID=A0A0F2M9S2_SPOSC|nr:uncharacterized protein SPSK_02860 [Sporothrix schenckii 1099-18]KJR86433.1 hypothetical protein SPSK_02860 [Sporothrix schenckii 1099-18]